MPIMPENIPTELKDLDQWVVWKLEERKNGDGEIKKTKVPYQINGKKADSMNTATWTSFQKACDAAKTGKYNGVGFVFTEESGIVGIDLDHIKNGETWDSEALNEINLLSSYSEISPSGTGAHVFVRATIPGSKRRSGPREMYSSGRFFTVTGDIFSQERGVKEAQNELSALYSKWFERESKNQDIEERREKSLLSAFQSSIPTSPKLTDYEILRRLRRAKNADEFEKLYNGDWTGYPSQSEADLKLCSLIAFYTQDPDQVDNIFKSSKLYRNKWGRLDYKEKTISEAIKGLTKTYNPDKKLETNKETNKKTKKEVNENYFIELDEIDIDKDKIAKAEKTALQIMKQGDPIEYILKTIKKYHTGDEKTQEGLCISIAGQSCLNTAGIQISVNGSSGSGKSHAVKSHLHLISRKYKYETSLSAKAAYYMGLRPGDILFSDDTAPDEDMEEVIKRATTYYQETTTHTTVKNQEVKTVTIPPRINWYLTSVDSFVSEQMLNRQLTFNTDISEEQKKAIFRVQAKEALKGENGILEVTDRVLVCRRIYENIKSQYFKVAIPFADIIDIYDKSNSRNFPMFLDMIKGYTIFKHMQRKKDDEGRLLATIEDFERAKKLFESQAEGIITKLNEKERKILQYIAAHRKATINDISLNVNESYANVRKILKGRKDRDVEGLLDKVQGLKVFDESMTCTVEEGIKTSTKEERYVLENYNLWELFNGEFVFLNHEKRTYTDIFRKENESIMKNFFSCIC